VLGWSAAVVGVVAGGPAVAVVAAAGHEAQTDRAACLCHVHYQADRTPPQARSPVAVAAAAAADVAGAAARRAGGAGSR